VASGPSISSSAATIAGGVPAGAAWPPPLVAELRALQSAHPDLIIFEVSEDQDAYLWKNASRALPWICVQDLNHTAAQDYNAQSLPSFYAIRGTELKRLAEPADIFR